MGCQRESRKKRESTTLSKKKRTGEKRRRKYAKYVCRLKLINGFWTQSIVNDINN